VSQRTVEPEASAKPQATAVPPGAFPLSQAAAGTWVRIKAVQAAPDVCRRLREMGLCEDKVIKLVLQDRNVVCRLRNLRLGLGAKLADRILVEPEQPKKGKDR